MSFKSVKLAATAWSAAIAFASLVSVNGAKAALFSLTGVAGTDAGVFSTTLPANFGALPPLPDGVGIGTPIQYYTSGDVGGFGLKIAPSAVSITFTYMGSEAGDNNRQLLFDSTLVFDNQVPVAGTNPPFTQTFNVGGPPGLVPLVFKDLTEISSATNGGPMVGNVRIGFYIPGGSGPVAWAFFDDPGAGPDRDFDDLVVRMTAVDAETNPAPIPGAIFLFGSVLAGGIGGTQLMRRRRSVRAA